MIIDIKVIHSPHHPKRYVDRSRISHDPTLDSLNVQAANTLHQNHHSPYALRLVSAHKSTSTSSSSNSSSPSNLTQKWKWLSNSAAHLCSAILGTAAAASLSMSVPLPGTVHWDGTHFISGSSSSAWALTEENIVFLEAWRTLDRAYVDKTFNGQNWFKYRQDALRNLPMSNRDETYNAIRKMTASLDDPFTRFLDPEKLKTLRSGANGEVTGVGLEVAFSGGTQELVVVAPVTGGPAYRNGVQSGDVIVSIDGVGTEGMGLYDAAQRLQGPPRTEVEVKVRRPNGRNEEIVFDLLREKIDLNPVTWAACSESHNGKPIGYIRLSAFNQNSAGSVKKALEELKGQGVGSFVLDIRNNGGGLFPAGVDIARMWLNDGVVVYIADSMGIRDIYDSEPSQSISTEEPLAVLVNRGTASASEILAGALKDNGRATLLGETTFGKGKIQSVFELSDGSGLAVTVARYQTPAHIDIDKVGITPNKALPEGIPMESDKFCSCLGNDLRASDLFAKK